MRTSPECGGFFCDWVCLSVGARWWVFIRVSRQCVSEPCACALQIVSFKPPVGSDAAIWHVVYNDGDEVFRTFFHIC